MTKEIVSKQTLQKVANEIADDLELIKDDIDTLQASMLNHTHMVSAPASSVANGTIGQMAIDENYLYYCYAENTWKRIAIDTTAW